MHAGPTPPLDLANLPSTVQSSPDLNAVSNSLDDMPELEMESIPGPVRNLRHHPYGMSRRRKPSEALSDASSAAGMRTTPPQIPFLPRESSSGMSEDINMDSPSLHHQQEIQQQQAGIPPTAAEITRRINNKRRRDDDFDSMSMKRRAVSPGMSTHNSPVGQSPMQRDSVHWGSRQGSTAGGTPSENGASTPASNGIGGSSGAGNVSSGAGAGFATGSGTAGPGSRPVSGAGKGRVGLQGMTDTHDSLMRMSIEEL